MRDLEKLNKTCFLQWLPVHVNIEGNEKENKLAKKVRTNNNGKNKITILIHTNAFVEFKLREQKLYPTKNRFFKINADRLLT